MPNKNSAKAEMRNKIKAIEKKNPFKEKKVDSIETPGFGGSFGQVIPSLDGVGNTTPSYDFVPTQQNTVPTTGNQSSLFGGGIPSLDISLFSDISAPSSDGAFGNTNNLINTRASAESTTLNTDNLSKKEKKKAEKESKKLQKRLGALETPITTGDVAVDEIAQAKQDEEREVKQAQLDFLYASNSERKAIADQLIDKQGAYTDAEEEMAKRLYDDYNTKRKVEGYKGKVSQRDIDLLSGAEGYERARRMDSLGMRTSDKAAFVSNFASAIPGVRSATNKLEEIGSPNQNIPRTTDTIANSAMQNKTAAGAGALASKFAQYQTFTSMLKGIPGLNKVQQGLANKISTPLQGVADAMLAEGATNKALQYLAKGGAEKVGSGIADMTLDIIPDIALDTIPQVAENIESGMSGGEVAKKALGNIAGNMAFNAITGGIPIGIDAYKFGKGANNVADAIKATDELNPLDMARANEINASELNQLQEDALRNIEDGAKAVDEVAPNPVIEQLREGSLSTNQIDRILSDDALRQEIENEFGIELTGTKAEQRNLLKGLSEETPTDIPTLEAPTEAPLDATKDLPIVDEIKEAEEVIPENNLNPLSEEISPVEEPTIPTVADNVPKGIDRSDELALNSGDTNYSKVYTNTLTKERLADMNDLADRVNATYDVHHAEEVKAVSTKRLEDNYEAWDDYFRSESGEVGSDADVDTAMLLVHDKQAQIDELIKNGGSQADIDKLVAEKNLLKQKLRYAGTKSGQTIKAFDHWNGTPEGAIINAQRIMDQNAKKWVGSHKGMGKKVDSVAENIVDSVKAETDTIAESIKADTESIGETLKRETESISESLKSDDGSISITESTGTPKKRGRKSSVSLDEAKAKTSKKLDTAISRMWKNIEDTPKGAPKTHDEIRAEVVASLEKEFDDAATRFNDTDIDFLTNLVEEHVPVKKITSELESRLGDDPNWWYTLDESTPIKKPTISKLNSMLDKLGQPKPQPKAKISDTHYQIMRKVANTLEEKLPDAKFTDDDLHYIATMLEEKVPSDVMESQIIKRMQDGRWSTIDEATPIKKPTHSKLNNLLDNLGKPKAPEKAKTPQTHYQLMRKIANSLEEKLPDAKFTDDDYHYIATMYEEKVSADIIESQILKRLEDGKWSTIDESTKVFKRQNKRLDNILNQVNSKKVDYSKVTDRHFQKMREVGNSLEAKYGKDVFNDDDLYYITSMMEENIPDATIKAEIDKRLAGGKWQPIDNLRSSSEISQALKLLDEGEPVKPTPKTYSLDEIKSQVRNSIEREGAPFAKNFNDQDIDYLANMINSGASKKEIADMLNNKLANGVWDVPEETVQKVNDILNRANKYGANSKARVDLETQAFWELANSIGIKSSFADKLNAWRYFAMLGNPKTHVRNIIGNALFQGMTSMSNTLAALMEEGVDRLSPNGIERTKAILTPKDADLIKACANDAIEGNYRALSDGNKYISDVKGSIASQKEVFDSNIMRDATGGNNDLLTAEDFTAMKFKYKTSLAGYLKANKLDQTIFDAERQLEGIKEVEKTRLLNQYEIAYKKKVQAQVDKLNEARAYATKQAEYSAFHEDSKAAAWLTKVSNEAPTPIHYMIEGVVPYKKTPINILRSGVEYSPLNVVNDIYKGIQAKKGNVPINELLESMSKTFVGSSMVGLGAYLYAKGRLKSSNEDTKWQDNLEGIQNYSLEIGGKTYTIDFAAPFVMPLLLGAEVRKLHDAYNIPTTNEDGVVVEKDFWDHLSDGLQAITRLGSPIMETSMMSGVNDTLESLSQGDVLDAMGNLALTTTTGFASQSIPTLLGQMARTIDPTRRSTYTDQDNSIGRIFDKQLTKIQNKIPGLSMLNDPYVDVYGRQQRNSPVNTGNGGIDYFANRLYQTFSPSYIQDVNTTDVDEELRRLYDITKDPSVFFDLETAPKVDGSRLSKEDYTTYTTEKGEQIIPDLRELFRTEEYRNATDKQKAGMVKDYETVVKDYGKESVVPDFDMSEQNKYDRAYKQGGIPYLASELGDKYSSKADKKTLNDMDLPENQFAQKMLNAGGTEFETYQKAQKIASKYGEQISEQDYKRYIRTGEDGLDKFMQAKRMLKKNYNIESPSDSLVETAMSGDKEAIKKYIKVAKAAEPYGLNANETIIDVYDNYGGERGLKKWQEADKLVTNKYGRNLTKTMFEKYANGGEKGLAEYIEYSNMAEKYGLSYSSSVEKLINNTGEEGLKVYSTCPKNSNGNIVLAKLVPHLRQSGLSEREMGNILLSVVEPGDKTKEYFENKNAIALWRHYNKKY